MKTNEIDSGGHPNLQVVEAGQETQLPSPLLPCAVRKPSPMLASDICSHDIHQRLLEAQLRKRGSPGLEAIAVL